MSLPPFLSCDLQRRRCGSVGTLRSCSEMSKSLRASFCDAHGDVISMAQGCHVSSGTSSPLGFGTATKQAGRTFLAERIALALDVAGGRMMEEPVEERGGEHLIVEGLTPNRRSSYCSSR